MMKSLDRKLAAIAADPNTNEFILADAKDADMAFGIGAPGQSPEAHAGEVRFRTLREYREMIREIVRQELVDIMLMSASTTDVLAIGERLFENSPVTPAARANDTSDIFVVRGGKYLETPARPFRTASLDHIQCGHADCADDERHLGADLGLYSVTFTNNTALDLETLERFKEFRLEAERKKFRYFLEVFDPNVPAAVESDKLAAFQNDMIARCLAGVTRAQRPVFLKTVYHGPAAMEELFRYDPHLVIGVLGGSAGTTHDAFKLLTEAKKYGAKAALFGRKINQAENQFAFIRFLRYLADGVISPEEGVRAYHSVLERLGIPPRRPLAEDLELTTGIMSYGGSNKTISVPAPQPSSNGAGKGTIAPLTTSAKTTNGAVSKSAPAGCRCGCGGKEKEKGASGSACPKSNSSRPNFAQMSADERLAYHQRRIARIVGDR